MESKEIEILLKKYKILKEIAKFLKVEEDKILNTLKRFKSEIEEAKK
ncbi:MAG: hypothetical protein QXP34_01175 [Candidatus Aenigmatarchaeota archaeon]